jgi:hypothetical protein
VAARSESAERAIIGKMLTSVQRLVLVATLAATSFSFSVACTEGSGESVSSTGALVEQSPAASDGDVKPGPPDAEAMKAQHTQRLKEMDVYGRGLLKSFEDRAYSPARDAGLKSATALIDVQIGSAKGSFRATFDAAQPEDKRVSVTPDPANAELPSGTEEQVAKWARLSFDGAYREVVHYLPPNKVLVTPSKDGKHRVVTAQPHRHNVQVSYSVDEADIVKIRGTSVIPDAEIVHFTWEEWRGRQMLSEMTFRGTESGVTFEYDDQATQGVVLLKSARLHQGENVFDADFRYEGVDAGD